MVKQWLNNQLRIIKNPRSTTEQGHRKTMKKLLFNGKYGDVTTVFAAFVELNDAVDKCKEGVVFTHANILARVVGGAALANDDVAGDAFLTTKDFHA